MKRKGAERTMSTGRTRTAASTATRDRILDAAGAVFIGTGYRAASMRDIAVAAGMSHQGVRRHFCSKASLLAAVLDRFDANADESVASDPTLDLAESVRRIATANEANVGWTRLFASASGEGTALDHPLHDAMRTRYARHRIAMSHVVDRSRRAGSVAATRDPLDTAIRLTAIWDGMQLLNLYLGDEVDVVAAMVDETARLRTTPAPLSIWARRDTPTPAQGAQPRADGFGAGRARRDDILDSAIDLFTRRGLGETSTSDIATQVGVTKATLFHHYPTKDALARAAMRHAHAGFDAVTNYASRLRDVARIRASAARAQGLVRHAPTLIRLNATITAESSTDSHPLHTDFRDMIADNVRLLENAYAASQLTGDTRHPIDARREALRHVALWEGLQVQWCYDSTAIDFARHMREHVDELLTPA